VGLYVEVMCDRRKDGMASNGLSHLCWSNRNDNPQGPNIKAAKSEARSQGWKLGVRHKAICPGCLQDRTLAQGASRE